jgi:Neu-associated kinase
VIDKKKAKDDAYVHRNLRREAKLLQMLRQRNIIQLLEVVETDNSYYLVTELCKGGELMDHICKQQHLDEDEVRKYVRQIVLAVHHFHMAGIVHRDLKVENLLLDENMDVKIIDFGLSNTYGTPAPTNGYIVPTDHCHTQCGSPAYAAPELLGHKNYGPEVDVWSIGVNMYAMLTGSLPFTVEPFNISVLHAKMLDNKMNPIPERLSANCKDLLLKLLTPKPEERITLPGVFNHPWLNEDLTVAFTPDNYPNRLSPSDLNESILQYMTETLRFCYSDIVSAVTNNKAVKAAAVYHLLVKRLQRYEKTRPKEFAFQRPQVQQSTTKKGKKNCEHPPLERRTSGESKEVRQCSTPQVRYRSFSLLMF